MINIEEIVQDDLNQLWKKYDNEWFCKLPPLYPKEIKEDGLVFIGINPSISDDERKQVLTEVKGAKQHYDLHGGDEVHKYFKKFIEISEKTNLDWTHFDLLYIRETKQSKVGDLIKTAKGLDFIYQQCEIAKKIIDKLIKQKEKKIFVVNNTLARLLLGKEKSYDGKHNVWMGYDFEWSNTIGTYTLNGHPFFFSSMLVGQRALDKGSYERLIWHIELANIYLQHKTKDAALKQQFEIKGCFYDKKKQGYRSLLTIKRKDVKVKACDLLVVMMNPGGSKPLEEAKGKNKLVDAKPDSTQYQIMKLMNLLHFNHATIINLSDFRDAKSRKFIKQLSNGEIKYDQHSIFDKNRKEELNALLKTNSPTLIAWGLSKKLNEIKSEALNKLSAQKVFGYQKQGSKLHFYHPMKFADQLKFDWLKNTYYSYKP